MQLTINEVDVVTQINLRRYWLQDGNSINFIGKCPRTTERKTFSKKFPSVECALRFATFLENSLGHAKGSKKVKAAILYLDDKPMWKVMEPENSFGK